MDPAFWTALPAIIAAVMAGITAIIAANGNRKIDENTRVTTVGQEAAVTAVTKSALATGHVIQQNKEIAAKAEKIEERLNGGPGGLVDLTLRMASLEAKHEQLAQGHVEIKNAIDRMTDAVKKQSNF